MKFESDILSSFNGSVDLILQNLISQGNFIDKTTPFPGNLAFWIDGRNSKIGLIGIVKEVFSNAVRVVYVVKLDKNNYKIVDEIKTLDFQEGNGLNLKGFVYLS